MTNESERATERRMERQPRHEVVDYVEREHSMNGRPCENPWAVMRIWKTGDIVFYCGECNVGYHSGPGYEELLEKTDATQNTNPKARGYPPDHIHPVTRGVYFRSEHVYHVPPERMGGGPW